MSLEPYLFQSKQTDVSQLFCIGAVLQPFLWPSSGLIPQVNVLLCQGAQRWLQYSSWSLMRREPRGKTTSLALLVTHFLMQVRTQLAFWAGKAHCQLISNIFFTSIATSFSTGLLSINSFSNVYSYWGLLWCRCRALYLVLLNFIRLSWAQFTILSRSLWIASLSFLSCTNSLRWTQPHYVINKGVKQHQAWYGPLRNVTCYSSPFGPLSHCNLFHPSLFQFLIRLLLHPSNPYCSNLSTEMLAWTVSMAL